MKHGPGPERAGHLWHVLDAHAGAGTGWSLRGTARPTALQSAVQAPYIQGVERMLESVMAVKTCRIEMRADPESEERIAQAAAARQQSVSTFVLAAAVREADMVLARADVTLMPVEQFDALMDSWRSPTRCRACWRPPAGLAGSSERERVPLPGPRRRSPPRRLHLRKGPPGRLAEEPGAPCPRRRHRADLRVDPARLLGRAGLLLERSDTGRPLRSPPAAHRGLLGHTGLPAGQAGPGPHLAEAGSGWGAAAGRLGQDHRRRQGGRRSPDRRGRHRRASGRLLPPPRLHLRR